MRMGQPGDWDGIVAVTVAQANASGLALHDQLTAIRARDEARDGDGRALRARAG